MATTPKTVNLTATSVEILNAIRTKASPYYKNLVPEASPNTESIRSIGNIVMNYEPLQNEFLSTLYNRIGKVIVTSKTYNNPWVHFKKGLLELGETVEEIFVDISKAHEFDPDKASSEFMKREIPNVKATFHTMNYKKFYKSTISNEQLRQAFISWDGITDLISRIVNAMYTAHNYDEFQVTKYMLARNILNGYLYPVTVPSLTKGNSHDIITAVKIESDKMTYLSNKYNLAGVNTFSSKENQYVITTPDFDSIVDVNVLATAFNMDKAEFMGKRVQIDGFGCLDDERLKVLFTDDPNNTYVPLTEAEKTALNSVPAILIDRDYFMIFDNMQTFTEDYNGQGLYWNYWLHAWKTFSTSPYANADVFVPGNPSITSITVSPDTASITKGNTLQLNAYIVTEAFASKAVTWSVNSEFSSINALGLLTVPSTETSSALTVTVTSVFDTTKTATATITVV